jgi:hypothetical protein
MMDNEQLKWFLGGFDLCAKRLPNGQLQSLTGELLIDEWPQEITVAGNTYCLEYVNSPQPGDEEAVYC